MSHRKQQRPDNRAETDHVTLRGLDVVLRAQSFSRRLASPRLFGNE